MLVLVSRGNREPVATSSVDDGADPRVPERGRIMPRCYEFDSRPGPAAVVSIAAAATTAGAGLTRSIVDERDTLPETTAQALALVSAMPGDLRDRLIAYRAHSGRLNPAAAAAYDRLVAHLGAIYTGQVGPAVGVQIGRRRFRQEGTAQVGAGTAKLVHRPEGAVRPAEVHPAAGQAVTPTAATEIGDKIEQPVAAK